MSTAQRPDAPGSANASLAPAPAAADALLEEADALSHDQLDGLPYGMIQLDESGRILRYNATESRLAALPQQQQVGRHFFTEVAPCTRVQEFYGRFQEGVAQQSLDTSFQFHFAFRDHPRDVAVRMFYSARTRSVWVMIAERSGA